MREPTPAYAAVKLSPHASRSCLGLQDVEVSEAGRHSRCGVWDVETKSIVDSECSRPGERLRALLVRNQGASSWYGPREGVSSLLEGVLVHGELLPGDSGPIPS